MKFIEKKIKSLRKNILKYEYFYHTLNKSLVSDAEYDYLFYQLYNLELKNPSLITIDSPTQKVGANILNKFQTTRHFFPMFSLNNVFNLKSYRDFENKILKDLNSQESFNFCCELKFDGVAISIIYEEGKLIRASTRGNGFIGENITANACMIASIPSVLIGNDIPKRLEIRGEVCMLKSDFIKLNKRYNRNSKKIFSNPRNAASGSLRHLNPAVTAKRKLVFFCHGYGFFKGLESFSSHYERLKKLKAWGIPVRKETLIVSNYTQVYKFYQEYEKKRNLLDFEIDGIVIKLDSIILQKRLGYTAKSPRWAIAFKFSNQEKITKVINVHFQVGRTGIITPVADLEPVEIAGIVIKKASLYNKNEIYRLNLHINDSVIICRSGDVIPKIITVIKDKYNTYTKKILFPTSCPSCQSKLIFNKEDKIIRCYAGLICNAQKKKALVHFFSKNALNAKGLGPEIINALIELNIVENIIDFFYLTNFHLKKINYVDDKKSIRIINAILQSKKTTFSRFIFALGIDKVGKTISEKISFHFKSLDSLMNTNIFELNNIFGIGKIIAKNIFNYFAILENRRIVLELTEKIGIMWKKTNESINFSEKSFFFKKNIVLTGVLNLYSRTNLKNILVKLGARIMNHVSKHTNCLIVGKRPGSKLLKARLLDIKIINEIDLEKLL